MNSPEAIFDTLFIGERLQRKIDDFSEYEIQFFAYFSCLLSLYDGNTANDWKYSFAKTQLGSPFSNEISLSIKTLTASDNLIQNGETMGYFILTGSIITFRFEFSIPVAVISISSPFPSK